ncbi:Uncharacterised protein [Mycobacteroides abscessus subsp. abscessus]|nr:Uncharacterised protein [Mycobacteroides abscessus subsp. abscessus]
MRRPLRTTATRSPYSGSLGSGRVSMADEYMCTAASTRLTMTGASPSSGTTSGTTHRLLLKRPVMTPE